MSTTAKRVKVPSAKPNVDRNQRSAAGHEVPMNEPKVVDETDPSMFVGIEIKPSANEKQTRMFRQRMREIHKVNVVVLF